MRMFCSLLPFLVTVETSTRLNAETNTNCNIKLCVIKFFQNEKRLSRRQQQELNNHSVTERPDKLGLCSKRTERLKNIQQTAVSEQPNQAPKQSQAMGAGTEGW